MKPSQNSSRYLIIACLSASFLLCSCSKVQLAAASQGGADPGQAAVVDQGVTETITPTMTLPEPTATLTPTVTPTVEPTQTPTDVPCQSETGEMVIGQLETDILPDPLDYRIYLPPCYDTELDQSYPVLYYVHGSSYNDDQWDRIGADETADKLISSGQVKPFIIVMPRDRVWLPAEEDFFGDAVVEDLVPYIDQHYRTIPDRDHRAIGGLSRGAGWSLHIGVTHWELFGSISTHSPALFQIDMTNLRDYLKAIPDDQAPRFLVDVGKGDGTLDFAIWLRRVLMDRGFSLDYRIYDGYHNEVYWSSHVEEYLIWFTEPWNNE